MAVAICGLPGSGKSTLAHRLAEATGWQRLDRDALRQEMFTTGGYSIVDKAKLAVRMRDGMLESLARSYSVILDGMTFASAAEREEFAKHVGSAGARWLLVWLDCAPEIARARVSADTNHPAMDRDAALVDAVAARFEPPANALRVDAAVPPQHQLCTVLDALRGSTGDHDET